MHIAGFICMKKQQDPSLNLSTRRTRKEVLLNEVAFVMPWAELVAVIATHSPLAKTGRPPFDLEMMPRIHCLQQWFVVLISASKKQKPPSLEAWRLSHGSSTVTAKKAGSLGHVSI